MFQLEQCDKSGNAGENVHNKEIARLVPGVYRQINRARGNWPKSPRNGRAVLKSGEINVHSDRGAGLFANCFLALVEARWRWTLLSFFSAFTANWLLFGLVYWLVSLTHGDFREGHLPAGANETGHVPCIENTYGFTSTFLFSVEVHTTVAYGRRAITLECPHTIVAMCLQCIVSSIFQATMIGILFAKLTRPRSRTRTILFSKHSVISLRDGKLCLAFRVGDMRKSRILNVKVTAFALNLCARSGFPPNGEQVELKLEMVECESAFFLWPVHVVHVIDESSPLYDVSAADLLCGKWELLAVLEGTIESTGQPVQARSSFTVCEILWGHRFAPMVSYDCATRKYVVDFAKLSEYEQVETPLCAAHEYRLLTEQLSSMSGRGER